MAERLAKQYGLLFKMKVQASIQSPEMEGMILEMF